MRAPALPAAAAFLAVACVIAVRAQQLPDLGNRFEGLVDLPISGEEAPDLELISFTGAFEPFTLGVNLRVRFFLPSAHTQARVVAQELVQDRFYRMESKPAKWTPNAWATFSPWPTGAVIIPGKVQPSNIGVVVYLGDVLPGRAAVAPAFVEHTQAATTFPGYRVQLRPLRATLSAVDYSLARIGPSGPGSATSVPLRGERTERRPFAIDLSAADMVEGRYLLTVIGYVKNSTRQVRRQYEFEHRLLPR